MKKYKALEEHNCWLNDGNQVCECFDGGYKQGVGEERERIIKIMEDNFELLGINGDVWEDNFKKKYLLDKIKG